MISAVELLRKLKLFVFKKKKLRINENLQSLMHRLLIEMLGQRMYRKGIQLVCTHMNDLLIPFDIKKK
jgi:hypothetical protein